MDRAGPAAEHVGSEEPSIEPGLTGRGQPAEFVSASSAMDAVWRVVDRVAATDVPVLIRGESGVGKDVVARTIHARSPRHSRPFLKINCAALPASLLESELFGYQRGAFTGAANDTKGKFELASEGTLFLDEIGEMPPEMQAKLLQVLQDGEYFRVGGSKAIRVDTRVVVATNRDLEAEIARGGFRGDLYYRLNVVSVRVPALRERPEDIPPLVNHFMQKYARKYESGMDVVPDDVFDLFKRHPWPGNVRELENLVRRMVVLNDPRCILNEFVERPASVTDQPGAPVIASISTAQMSPVEALELLGVIKPGDLEHLGLKEVAHRAQVAAEREAIAHTLRKCAWNKRKTAQRLQISYKALLYKIKECGIVDPRIVHSLPESPPPAAPPPAPAAIVATTNSAHAA
jgi:two-component system response regulator AtoC